MAALQGYLLQHKDSHASAIEHVHSIAKHTSMSVGKANKPSSPTVASSTINSRGPVKPRPVKPLTVEQVDKLYFNPQQDWDKTL